jgi:hypothetical protein
MPQEYKIIRKAELVTFRNNESIIVLKLFYSKYLNYREHNEGTTSPYFWQSLALRHRIVASISATEFNTRWTRHSKRIHMQLQQIISRIREKYIIL